MAEASPVVVEPETSPDALALADRLDPAIGEASAMVGSMLTELLRRTLRGGVVRIGDEMHGYVSEKLDTALAERTPALERLAAEVAEHAARTAATEVATEEVHALEQRTQASTLELTGKITDKIAETAQAAEQRTREAAEALASKINETAQAAEQRTRETAETLAGQITETAQTAEQRTRQSAEALAAQISETEQRARDALQAQVDTLIDRSRERSERLKARLAGQDNLIASLTKKLGTATKDLARLIQENQAALKKLEKEKESLAARIAELEKPRGLRALWQRLFGRRKPAEPAGDA